MKEDNKGITLIALVVTIIVLLILAGITIATLTDNQNGIFTNAKRARSNTVYSEADEKCRLALSAVQTEIAANVATDSSYDATKLASIQKMVSIINTDLNATSTDPTEGFVKISDQYSEGYTGASNHAGGSLDVSQFTLNIVYRNKSFMVGSFDGTIPKDNTKVEGSIVLKKQDAEYNKLQ